MMDYRFHPWAASEYLEAATYYNRCREGLGDVFLEEVEATVKRIRENPDLWPRLSASVRRSRIRNFPYAMIYTKNETGVLILAVMHLSRKPGYWKQRLKDPEFQEFQGQ
ncbi:MAG: type II toxin-antitoxin system RelE/ParE family toxin [Planctomycetota bacterium]